MIHCLKGTIDPLEMSSITKVKFQSINFLIESTTFIESVVAFWISYLQHCLETASKTAAPFVFSTLAYSTINLHLVYVALSL